MSFAKIFEAPFGKKNYNLETGDHNKKYQKWGIKQPMKKHQDQYHHYIGKDIELKYRALLSVDWSIIMMILVLPF